MTQLTKKILGFPDYLITRDGKVYSTVTKRYRKLVPDKDGYLTLNLHTPTLKNVGHKAHRLVAQAFIPNPDNLPQVNHLDGDKTNNHVGNLEWTTNRKNSQHCLLTGLKKTKLSQTQVRDIRKDSRKLKIISEEYGVSQSTISRIRNGKRWGCLSET